MKKFFILPFDHRSSFMKNMFGITGREPNATEVATICEYKYLIYEGFKRAVNDSRIPLESAAILVDEQFGDAVLRSAKEEGFTFCLCVEKSGQDEFDFEYGNAFGEHINQYRPTIVKALLRYNPDGDTELNRRQRERLKVLSDFCQANGYLFMIEPLLPATKDQLASVGDDQHRYDNEIRPALMVRMIAEMQADAIACDIWKIEGLEKSEEYQLVVTQARSGGRNHVVCIVLGRGADDAQVEHWLRAGSSVSGIVGFAIGRTIFWQPLVDYRDGKKTSDEAAAAIADRYVHFYQVFTEAS